jgi:uncharacterized protein
VKYLVLALILAVAYLLWRNGRIARRAAPPPSAQPTAAPQDMVSCCVCTVHLPRGDAVAGGDGRLYCSQEHRLRGDGPKG